MGKGIWKTYLVIALENKDGKDSVPKIVVQPTAIVARDENDAIVKFMIEAHEKLNLVSPDALDIQVFPF